jgi:ferrous iron transport protein A
MNATSLDLLARGIIAMKRLSHVPIGSVVRIVSFENNDIFLKLMEMGCVPGEIIRVEQVAPLGDPIAISVSGYNLSLRLDEAQNIFVEKVAGL